MGLSLKKTLLGLLWAASSWHPAAGAAVPGDAAFTSFNADNDSAAFVVLFDVAPDQTLYITDNEWDGSAFSAGESFLAWNAGSAGVAAGTVIGLAGLANTAPTSSTGSLSRLAVPGNTLGGLSQTADTLYLYLGSSATAPTAFLAAITNGDLTVTDGTLTGTGLTLGVNALQLATGSDSADYTGARSGIVALGGYRPLLFDAGQWQDNGDGNFSARSPDLTAFNAPIPEPAWPWLAATGLAVLALQRRRHRKAP